MDSCTEWLGSISATDGANGFGEPIALSVLHFFASGEWLGLLSMPTNGTKVLARGVLLPLSGPPMENGELSHVVFIQTDTSLISGSDTRLKHMLKKGFLDTCTKTLKFSEGNHPPIMTLTYVQHTPTRDLAFLQPGTVWKGVAPTESTNFRLDIAHLNNDTFEGNIVWHDLGITTTVKGSIGKQGELKFEENGVVRDATTHAMEEDDQVDMPPTKYHCKPVPQLSPPTLPNQTTFTGRWSASLNGNNTTGTVTLKPM